MRRFVVAGIPVSSQWSSSGHIYPIQVAQFGLSHYSKNISEEPPRQRIIADFGTDVDVTVSADCFSERLELEDETMVLNFSAPGMAASVRSAPLSLQPGRRAAASVNGTGRKS